MLDVDGWKNQLNQYTHVSQALCSILKKSILSLDGGPSKA